MIRLDRELRRRSRNRWIGEVVEVKDGHTLRKYGTLET